VSDYTIKKYDGDDPYCYAIFRKRDVMRMGYVIFYGEANPVVSGLSKIEAQAHKQSLDKEEKDGSL